MTKTEFIQFRATTIDEANVIELSKKMNCSKSEAIRYSVRSVLADFQPANLDDLAPLEDADFQPANLDDLAPLEDADFQPANLDDFRPASLEDFQPL